MIYPTIPQNTRPVVEIPFGIFNNVPQVGQPFKCYWRSMSRLTAIAFVIACTDDAIDTEQKHSR